MTDKLALVTGASGGIGRAIALALAGEGTRLALHYHGGEASANELATAIRDAGGDAFTIRADLADVAAIRGMAAEVADRLGGALDILVNNAGTGNGAATLSATTDADYETLMAVNVRAPFLLTQALVPIIRPGGAIINLSSMVSRAAYPSCIAYAMAKNAVNSFTTSLAVELGPRGISVNAVAPGATDTAFIANLASDPQTKAYLEGQTAFNRLGTPKDIAEVVAFLASPGGRWVTGQIIEASGGMHL